MKTIHFILGIHNHQPVGNFDHVFEDAYRKSYLPFLEVLERHPQIRLMYHTTGPLLDWLELHHPDFLDRVRSLVESNQMEVMTGGYYEPILAVIPDRDKAGQINKLTQYSTQRFGMTPRGMWMAERIWEPHLARSLAECCVEFITLDDYHFHSAGMQPQDLLGYYRTDEQGRGIAVFPISIDLRYLIPFKEPEKTIAYLQSRADDKGSNLLVMADDGEKFGLWPGTYEWVHKKGWLERFFNQLEAAMAAGWLKMTTGSEFLDSYPPRGRVFLPCASYFEMSTWSLPAKSGAVLDEIIHRYENENRLDELRPYLKGGFWRNFLTKYDESNYMYRKMLWVSEQIAELEASLPANKRKQRATLEAARVCLYKAQCNCAY
ncbi:MAG: alpha-amylase/4-alpha-glucanotransferase domain-containing protein, partial [bacterium]